MSDFGVGVWYAMVHETTSAPHSLSIDHRLDMVVKSDMVLSSRGLVYLDATKLCRFSFLCC